MCLINPLKTIWFLPLAHQSTHRFKFLNYRGQGVPYCRFIDDSGGLNWSDVGENRYKTESRRLHNAKLAFLIFKNQPTKFDFLTAYVYSRMSDSGLICGLEFPWTAAHCDQCPFITDELDAKVPIGKRFVYCRKCTVTYGESDLHYVFKYVALMLSASALLHARKTAFKTVINIFHI